MSSDTPLDTRLADLQRTVEVGFATMKGEMALFTERDRVADALHEQQQRAMGELGARVDGLERRIARAAGAAIGVSGALSGASGLIVWALSRR